MKAITKKQIRHSVEDAIQQVLLKFELASPSHKSEKLTGNFSKKLARNIKRDLKKQRSATEKAAKKIARKNAKKKRKSVDAPAATKL